VAESSRIDCAAALARIHELLDNELDTVSADAVRAHLLACEACMDDADAVAMMKEIVKRACRCEPAPQTLVARISMSITEIRMR
jgi:anti-sigma factor (TIGR02949 family)